MKRIGALFIIFLSAVLITVYWKTASSPRFYKVDKDSEFQQSAPLKYNSITINNCSEYEASVGEVFLGKALENALKLSFKNVSMDYRLSMYPEGKNDEIQIYIRGYFKFMPPFPDSNHINIAYLIYPVAYTENNPKMIKDRHKIVAQTLKYGNIALDELQFYDVIAVASKPYTEKLKKAGYKAYYVPQFTDTSKFYEEYNNDLKSDVLFVGTYRSYGAAEIVIKNNLPITIYGPNWGERAKAEYIDNEELHKYYSSAKIVLNDHRPDMKESGFINNRTFDVTATGALLVSDYMPEIEEIYGDSVPMYKTEEELVQIIQYYLSHEEERQEKAKKAKAITLKYFTQKNIAEAFKEIISKERK